MPYNFQFIAGPASVQDSVDVKPGLNILRAIVNNTGNGIYGKIQPISNDSPSNFGIKAKVTYTP